MGEVWISGEKGTIACLQSLRRQAWQRSCLTVILLSTAAGGLLDSELDEAECCAYKHESIFHPCP